MEQVEQGLISAKEAFNKLCDGYNVQFLEDSQWLSLKEYIGNFSALDFMGDDIKFRIKPKTILLNGIEIPAPFEPKEGQYFYYLSSVVDKGYNIMNWNTDHYECYCQYGAWKSEDEIKQVVAALRNVFKGE